MTYDLPTLVYTLHGIEHRTDLTVEHLLGQPRFSRGILLMMMTPYTGSTLGWLRGTVVERRSLTGELSLSCARPAADR